MTITWNPVSGATSYNVYMASQSGVTKNNYSALTGGMKHTGATSPFVHTGLSNGTTYYFVVTSVNASGESAVSAEITATPSNPTGVINLPKTGQTTCYDSAGTIIPCAGTGQDGDIQAGVAWPSPRFTINGDCVTDNLTGLMWIRSPDSVTRTWQQALDYANGLSLCGYSDWRLPNVNELESLVNAGQLNSATWLNTQGFSNVQFFYYWSSTSYTDLTNNSWVIDMGGEGMVGNDSKYYNYYIWPVRSEKSGSAQLWETGQTTCYDSVGNVVACTGTGQDAEIRAGVSWPSPRFTVSTDGYCVTDNLTGLMWVRSPDSVIRTWQQALDYGNGLSLCGYSDWRLPNRKELHSLTDYSQYNPALPIDHPFLNVHSYYWSSTTHGDYLDGAWVVVMQDGWIEPSVNISIIKTSSYYVWPVRGGVP